MSKLTKPIIVADASTGLIDDLSVGKGLLPANAVRKAINVLFDYPRGSVTQRYGTTKVGSTVSNGNTILGLYNFRSSNSSYNQLYGVATSSLYRLNAGSWTLTVVGLSNGLKTRFVTFLDTVAMMNGTDSVQTSTDGVTWVASGGALDTGNFPKGRFSTIINTRILTGGIIATPDTIRLSSLVSAGAVSWTSGDKTIQVSPNDGGGGITGVTGNGRIALIFKERGLYRYDDTELQRIGFVGTPSYESITTDDNGVVYFFGQGANGVGFYRTNGSIPQKISRPIERYINAISPSFYGNVAGIFDGNRIRWSVGSITIGDNTYSNACVVYVPSDGSWSVFNYADSFRVCAQYIDANGNLSTVAGDASGDIQTLDSGTTDNGEPIYAEVEYAPQVFTTRGRTKTVSEFATYAETFNGLQASMLIDSQLPILLGNVDARTKNFDRLPLLKGNEFIPKFTSVNTGTPWSLTGFEFPADSIIDSGNQRT